MPLAKEKKKAISTTILGKWVSPHLLMLTRQQLEGQKQSMRYQSFL